MHHVEWLTDKGSCYIADATRTFASSLGVNSVSNACTPSESHGIAESFVKAFKQDYVCINDLPDAVSVMKTAVIKEFPVKRLEMLRLTALMKSYKS